MFPGLMTKISDSVVASAATIVVKSDLVRLSGTTQINTITTPLSLSIEGGMIIFLVATDGAITLGTTGNILVGQSLAQNRIYTLVFSAAVNKWYISGVV